MTLETSRLSFSMRCEKSSSAPSKVLARAMTLLREGPGEGGLASESRTRFLSRSMRSPRVSGVSSPFSSAAVVASSSLSPLPSDSAAFSVSVGVAVAALSSLSLAASLAASLLGSLSLPDESATKGRRKVLERFDLPSFPLGAEETELERRRDDTRSVTLFSFLYPVFRLFFFLSSSISGEAAVAAGASFSSLSSFFFASTAVSLFLVALFAAACSSCSAVSASSWGSPSPRDETYSRRILRMLGVRNFFATLKIVPASLPEMNGSAPKFRRMLMLSACPPRTAKCRAVSPNLVWRLGLAPLLRRMRRQ
mmetsp:Transcript_1050/g.3746  ORF Transcript_1050/g.3746 Transcript_1050/m.3746 type:complete len:309 (+) Transcript_1050:736-1662(+)